MRKELKDELNDFIFMKRNESNLINNNNNTKLLDVIKLFNELYKKFKLEYSQLPKFDLSKTIKYSLFLDSQDNTMLSFNLVDVNDGIYNEEGWIALDIFSLNNQIFANLSNKRYDHKSYCKRINLDKDVLKKYLEVFKNNILFIKLYEKLYSFTSFSENIKFLSIQVSDNIIEDLKLSLSFSDPSINGSDIIDITFLLGEDFKITDYKLLFDFIKINDNDNKEEILNYILNNLYIENNKLPHMNQNNSVNEENSVLKKTFIINNK